MTTIFIDGESGTTGLRLRERIANRADLKLISLPADERRSPDARLEAMKAADVTVLCLPDDAAREAVKRQTKPAPACLTPRALTGPLPSGSTACRNS